MCHFQWHTIWSLLLLLICRYICCKAVAIGVINHFCFAWKIIQNKIRAGFSKSNHLKLSSDKKPLDITIIMMEFTLSASVSLLSVILVSRCFARFCRKYRRYFCYCCCWFYSNFQASNSVPYFRAADATVVVAPFFGSLVVSFSFTGFWCVCLFARLQMKC